MGGKWSVEARNLDDICLKYVWYGESFILFLAKSIKCLIKYEVVSIGKHGK